VQDDRSWQLGRLFYCGTTKMTALYRTIEVELALSAFILCSTEDAHGSWNIVEKAVIVGAIGSA